MTARRMNEIGDESRQRLLDAAEELFLEKGFEATTVVEIGKRAGISHGSIPWHFGNKSGVLYSVVVRLFDQTSSLDPLPTGQDGFNRLWREQTAHDNSEKFPLFGAFFMAEIERTGVHHTEMLQMHIDRRGLIADWIGRSIDRSALTHQLSDLEIVDFWLGASRGIVLQKVGLVDHFDLNAARRALGVSIDALLGQPYYRNLDKYL